MDCQAATITAVALECDHVGNMTIVGPNCISFEAFSMVFWRDVLEDFVSAL